MLANKYITKYRVTIHVLMIKSGGPEQARQMVESSFKLVGSHQHHVCTSCSGYTSFKYPKASPVIVISGIHPPHYTLGTLPPHLKT